MLIAVPRSAAFSSPLTNIATAAFDDVILKDMGAKIEDLTDSVTALKKKAFPEEQDWDEEENLEQQKAAKRTRAKDEIKQQNDAKRPRETANMTPTFCLRWKIISLSVALIAITQLASGSIPGVSRLQTWSTRPYAEATKWYVLLYYMGHMY